MRLSCDYLENKMKIKDTLFKRKVDFRQEVLQDAERKVLR